MALVRKIYRASVMPLPNHVSECDSSTFSPLCRYIHLHVTAREADDALSECWLGGNLEKSCARSSYLLSPCDSLVASQLLACAVLPLLIAGAPNRVPAEDFCLVQKVRIVRWVFIQAWDV